jgi:DNA-binding GntR family transcriptional regulator
VAPLTQDDARELFSIIAEVEGLAARFAAMRSAEEREQLAIELTAINEQFRKASMARVQDHNKLWELDEKFHQRYVDAGAGSRLLALHRAVKPQIERYDRIYVSLLGRALSASIVEHATIIRAIKSGNPDIAQQSVQTNWRNAGERLSAVITSLGERGHW